MVNFIGWVLRRVRPLQAALKWSRQVCSWDVEYEKLLRDYAYLEHEGDLL